MRHGQQDACRCETLKVMLGHLEGIPSGGKGKREEGGGGRASRPSVAPASCNTRKRAELVCLMAILSAHPQQPIPAASEGAM